MSLFLDPKQQQAQPWLKLRAADISFRHFLLQQAGLPSLFSAYQGLFFALQVVFVNLLVRFFLLCNCFVQAEVSLKARDLPPVSFADSESVTLPGKDQEQIQPLKRDLQPLPS